MNSEQTSESQTSPQQLVQVNGVLARDDLLRPLDLLLATLRHAASDDARLRGHTAPHGDGKARRTADGRLLLPSGRWWSGPVESSADGDGRERGRRATADDGGRRRTTAANGRRRRPMTANSGGRRITAES